MDKICAEVVKTIYGYEDLCMLINDMPLDMFLYKETGDEKFKGLYCAWGKDMLWKSESRYIWELIDKLEGSLNIPVLVCPDDLEFSCIVVIAKVIITGDIVSWDKIGIISKENYDYQKERQSGILNIECWSAEQCEKYGSTLAWCDDGDEQWQKWIDENWEEEQMLRLHNYVDKYNQDDNNIDWIDVPKLNFNLEDYLKCIKRFKAELDY